MHEEAGSIILEVLRGFSFFFSVEKCHVKKNIYFSRNRREKKKKAFLRREMTQKSVNVWFQKILCRAQNPPPCQSVILYYQKSGSVLFV